MITCEIEEDLEWCYWELFKLVEILDELWKDCFKEYIEGSLFSVQCRDLAIFVIKRLIELFDWVDNCCLG